MDIIIDPILWLIKKLFKGIFFLIKGLFFGFDSNDKKETKKTQNSPKSTKSGKDEDKMGGLFSNYHPDRWTAEFRCKGEGHSITLLGGKTQPAEFEFVNELRKRRPEWDISQAKIIEIRRG